MEKKTINLKKTVYSLCNEEPEVAAILSELGFQDITKPGMLTTAGRIMTIPKGALMKKIDLDIIKQTFRERGYEVIE